MRLLAPALVGGLGSFALAVARGPDPLPSATDAAARLAALDGAGAWGAWAHAAGVAGLLPFHLLLAAALWTGGRALGGAGGGAWALFVGLGCPGVLDDAVSIGPGLAATACLAWAARGVATGKRRSALVGAAAAVVLLGAPDPLPVRDAIAAAGWISLAGAVAGLLLGGKDALTPMAAAVVATLLGAGPGPLLALACAAARPHPAFAVVGLAATVADLARRPTRPEPPDLAAAADWLGELGATRITADVDPPLNLPALQWLLRREGLSVTVVPPGPDADAALVAWTNPSAGAWRGLLPPHAAAWTAGPFDVRAWDRPLPPASLLAAGDATTHHPANQGLWALVDGQERGPLLTPASSAAVARTEAGWVVLYVRDQALWRATSDDGLTWRDAAPLGLAAFDPAPVRLPGGGWRLYASELSGDRTDVDPASHPTRIVSWSSPDLATFTRDPGERLAGVGLVDPAPVQDADGGWSLYYTAARREIRRARSPDGLAFAEDPAFSVPGATVPFPWDGWLLLQRPALATTTLYARGRSTERALEVCGTGASVADSRLYWTRAPEDAGCVPPVVLPARRGLP